MSQNMNFKHLLTALCFLLIAAFGLRAQIVTTTPDPLQEKSTGVTVYFHADSPLGNMGLAGLASTTAVYAHTGVITSKSNNEWKYAPTWGDNSAKYRLSYVSANLWKLDIGDIRTYYGITDATEKVERLCFVFRTGDNSKEGKTKSGGDIFVDVADEGFQMNFGISGGASAILSAPTELTFSATTTEKATISISVNGTQIGSAASATTLSASYKFSTTGSWTVTATASNGTETITKKLNVAYPGASTSGTYPGGVPKMGAVRNADGTVTFCLAAPGKSSVVLVPSWDNFQLLDKNVMKYQDYQGQRYFFTTVSGLNDTDYYSYYYMVDATYKVGDPYARLVLDPYSDKWLDSSIWPDMPRYPYDVLDDVVLAVYKAGMDTDFKFSPFTIPDHSSLVIYELLVRDFTGTNGKADASGTLRKAMERIPYLSSLGVNAIELMPVMEFNGNNSWGYNTNFYMAPDKAYGSPRDLKEFVELCHKNGMAVILDIVFNQCDGLHPWYQMYNIESNPFYNQNAPHDYSVLNDWKQENPLVQQQWKDALKLWLTAYNVDGFRFDLVKGLGTSYTGGTNAYNKSRVEVMKSLHEAMRQVKPDAIHINENLAGAQEENEMAADGQLNWANINDPACQFAMAYADRSDLSRFLSTKDSRTAMSTVSYAESHDEERVAYKQKQYGATTVKNSTDVQLKRLAQVAVQMLLTPGPKMIWQFGELGASQTTKNADGGNNTDPKTVVWNLLDQPANKALHDVYSTLCNLRKYNPELFEATAEFVQTGFGNTLGNRIMRLTSGQKEVMAFINTSTGTALKTISTSSTMLNANNCQLIAATNGLTTTPTLSGTGTSVSVRLPGNSFAVFATKATSGVDNIVTDGANGSNVTIAGGEGCIVINGEYQSVQVYDLQGRLQGSLNVRPGLYIVRVDGTVAKVQVR